MGKGETVKKRHFARPENHQLEIKNWNWLSGLDSNQDKCLQRALCYRYTTGQTAELLHTASCMRGIVSENVGKPPANA